MPPLVVATWNLSHAVKRGDVSRAAASRHLADTISPDVGLVQEGGGVSGASDEIGVTVPSSGPSWGTRVVSYGPTILPLAQPLRPGWNRALEFEIPCISREGTLAVAMIDVGDGEPLVAISLYGQLRYADQSVLRAITDLIPLFDTRLGRRVILGGDLNIHTHSNDDAERRRAVPILGLLEAIGLRNLVREAGIRGTLRQGSIAGELATCPCGVRDCYHVKTHHRPNQRPGAMANNDYLFGTEWVVDRLESLEVMNGDGDPAWTHSDHAPIVARIAQ